MALPSIKISKGVLATEYHGAGKAWAAVKDGEVIALRYLGADRSPISLPAWVDAVRKNANGLDNSMLPTAHGSRTLAAIASAASACVDCPMKPNGGRYRPKELLRMARAAILVADRSAFEAYRTKCRTELASLGEVVVGICSCTEFILF